MVLYYPAGLIVNSVVDMSFSCFFFFLVSFTCDQFKFRTVSDWNQDVIQLHLPLAKSINHAFRGIKEWCAAELRFYSYFSFGFPNSYACHHPAWTSIVTCDVNSVVVVGIFPAFFSRMNSIYSRRPINGQTHECVAVWGISLWNDIKCLLASESHLNPNPNQMQQLKMLKKW